MGMDVYGKNQESETGKYFRNNCWWWRPLWDYCRKVAPQVIGESLHTSGHYNSGAGLDDENATALANVLQAEVDSGRCASYAARYTGELEMTPDESCDLCAGSGVRKDIKCDDGCNKCHGKGTVRPYSTWYPFSVENVKEFVAFLRECRGFEIF